MSVELKVLNCEFMDNRCPDHRAYSAKHGRGSNSFEDLFYQNQELCTRGGIGCSTRKKYQEQLIKK